MAKYAPPGPTKEMVSKPAAMAGPIIIGSESAD